jgi:pyruvate formate lyase activating enzyme
VSDGLVDYVAMDIKNSPERYGLTVGLEKPDLRAMEESIRFLLSGAVDYELRTTVVLPLHTEASVSQMGQWLYSLNGGEKIPRLYLQPFVDRDTVPVAGLSAPDASELDTFVSKLTPFVAFVKVRGI